MGYLYTAFVIAASVAIKTLIWDRWERFKGRQALLPQTMRLNRKGVYVPWGIVQRIERVCYIILAMWAAWLAAMIGVGLHYKLVLHQQPDLVTILTAGMF